MVVDFLRKKYPKFVYRKYSYKIQKGNLKISFVFEIPPDIRFKPEITVKNVKRKLFAKRLTKKAFDNLIFHLGLIEIPSYWKITCSPIIDIQAGFLNSKQVKWWKDLFLKGMGQFFYENKIDWRLKSFLVIKNQAKKNNFSVFGKKLKNRYLIPFAGGRDSIFTLENLKNKKETALFLVNPNEQIRKVAEITGVAEKITVKRKIDKKLLELNEKGFLNGHTPFTALLSFLSVFCGVLFNYKNIVFSNEKSADEGNVNFLGRKINHQWAKSSEFEKMFRIYSKKYLAKKINYFSYLRKYGELEISKELIKYPQYFPFFSSCNASMKVGAKPIRWCGNCPKCLFVYASFYPFLDKDQLFKIFGNDFFKNRSLLPIMKSLTEKKKIKPFECVGTKKENQKAFYLSFKKAQKIGKIPYLLKKLKRNLKKKINPAPKIKP